MVVLVGPDTLYNLPVCYQTVCVRPAVSEGTARDKFIFLPGVSAKNRARAGSPGHTFPEVVSESVEKTYCFLKAQICITWTKCMQGAPVGLMMHNIASS